MIIFWLIWLAVFVVLRLLHERQTSRENYKLRKRFWRSFPSYVDGFRFPEMGPKQVPYDPDHIAYLKRKKELYR